MSGKYLFTSLTRISDLREREMQVVGVPRADWATGDYVAGEVTNDSTMPIELVSGRMAEVFRGDLVIGAFGERHATLEAVGSWRDIDADGRMHALTGAGLFGRVTSVSRVLPPLAELRYLGHVSVDGHVACMDDYARLDGDAAFDIPTVLVVGTSMSAGKTTTARIIVRLLKAAGLRIVGAKLTGAARYRDVLGLRDAGADAVVDFVDVGMPSSMGEPEAYRRRLRALLSLIAEQRPDVLVAEAGASPLEPYNGDTAMRELQGHVRCLVLAAADPYAVVGVQQAFGVRPDVVTGVATSTRAGCELIGKLTELQAVNVLEPAERSHLGAILERCLGLRPGTI